MCMIWNPQFWSQALCWFRFCSGSRSTKPHEWGLGAIRRVGLVECVYHCFRGRKGACFYAKRVQLAQLYYLCLLYSYSWAAVPHVFFLMKTKHGCTKCWMLFSLFLKCFWDSASQVPAHRSKLLMLPWLLEGLLKVKNWWNQVRVVLHKKSDKK